MQHIGSREWNNEMFLSHPTPYTGIAGWIERRRLQRIIEAIRQYCPNSELEIVELGCEAGNLMVALHQAFPDAQLVGADISDYALTIAQDKLPEDSCRWILADICLPIPYYAKADVIICSETLEHIPDYRKALDQIEKLLDEESLLILTVPLEGLKNQIKKILKKLGLMKVFFPGIESGFSDWHVQDFKSESFKAEMEERFELLEYEQIMGLHQIVVAKKKML
ncbi:MAG: class I SAM-dependent methyltransferase [Bacteroidia bacterium]|nr:class I SAM-dependent methyltransferase [Bacteroidia bacterium]